MDAAVIVTLLVVAIGCLGLWWTLTPDPTPTPRARISSRDPLLVSARAQAQGTLEQLQDLLVDHRTQAQVKRQVGSGPEYRGQWSDVLGWDRHTVTLQERGRTLQHRVPWRQVEDWQVTLGDGTVRGGFTVVAAWRIRERQTGRLPTEAERELPRFADGGLYEP